MGLFDLFSDAKDNMDKSKQAREYIQRAKQLVREGNELYENAYVKVSSYAADTEYKLRQHARYKEQIAKELGGTIGTTLKDFGSFDIDSKTITAPSFQETNTGLPVFGSMVSSCMPHVEIPSIFDVFISDSDYYEARRQRDEAKYYKERMKMEREKLYNYKEKMSEICTFISSEKNVLDSLMEKLRKMTNELKAGMEKDRFSMKESEYLKGIHKIAEYITGLLSTDFLGDTFCISERYQKIFAGIQNINNSLPETPSITDNNTVAAIKGILDRTIEY